MAPLSKEEMAYVFDRKEKNGEESGTCHDYLAQHIRSPLHNPVSSPDLKSRKGSLHAQTP